MREKELHGHPNKKVFDKPLVKRLRMGIQSTTIWVGLAEEVFWSYFIIILTL